MTEKYLPFKVQTCLLYTSDRRVRAGTRTRDDGGCDPADRRQSQHAQAAFPGPGQTGATKAARGGTGGLV